MPGSDQLSRFGRALTAGRPAQAWSLALLFVFKGVICAAVLISPISPNEPTRMLSVLGTITVLAGFSVWLWGARISALGFELFAALGAVAASALVARANTHGGMMIAAFAYPWIAIYAAHFFPRRAVTLLGAMISVGFGVGLSIDGLSNAGVYWVIVTATTWSICLVLGQLSESLRRQADTDPLTGLLNRAGFLAAAEREHAIAQRTGAPLTLAVLDLDGFKQINDRHGHSVGDRLLVDLARSWMLRLRAGDILARQGGDEFVLLLPSTSVDAADAVIERLRDERLPVGWSMGICAWQPRESFEQCLARADARLYSAKSETARAPGDGAWVAPRPSDVRPEAVPLLGYV